jgi:Ran GTPase-activating protein (RanGAP) involved in mRNA processing and transport
MEALYKADNLRKLSLSKNELDASICDHLSLMPTRLHKFESLCLSHCLIDDEGLQSLCNGLKGETSLKYLDLSWNFIQPESMQYILEMLRENQNLEKLYIQHNSLGVQGAE